ncbi:MULTISPECIES: kynureninase [unclassified Sphingopyxis]|uniref:kynureninase n=1 Tax=unclassified Sphingopyxis TaxID=2614943 RepID=UPI0007302167|nr:MULTISPECIES: kynureninase [unclassified Sphingopyxis]KTE26329.1 kynureninase [Sphingopyxis sp. H057]KTE52732.1 kynureninase [Sphingopyxis sp. H073]KTE54922.1 kynureninase [Sphingopyxis sp. H071]KTE62382.1 kynureninase [Sphingopyxis sp. H107]KTE65928.1 kynureninase [Sphingopyxis sp. H100]
MTLDAANLDRAACAALDRADPLAPLRDRFALPEGMIYLDGNSLGAMPKGAAARAQDVVTREWGIDLIKSWNSAGWFDLPVRLGDKLAPLIGAAPGEVVICDSTSQNLFKVLSAAVALRPDRSVLILEGSNFPTNNYIAEGVAAATGGRVTVRLCEKDEIAGAIDGDTIAVAITHVHYKTGHIHDMAAITERAHAAGALAIWDLCHSAGAMPVDLNGAGADFAVGCTYKYLNGSPGSPAFLFAAERHQGQALQPVTGWWGHAAPFAFEPGYRPQRDIRQFLIGTQPILSMALVETGIDIHLAADMAAIRAKSMALTDLFIRLVETRCAGHGFTLASPREAAARGSQVSFAHVEGYPIMRALIAAGVIGDFRAPDTVRFGFTPLYVRFVDVWDAVDRLVAIMDGDIWKQSEYQAREAVT